MWYRAVITLLAGITLSACNMSSGQTIDQSVLPQITPGVTTKENVRQYLGAPASDEVAADGDETWGYGSTQLRGITIFGAGMGGKQRTVSVTFTGDTVSKCQVIDQFIPSAFDRLSGNGNASYRSVPCSQATTAAKN